ncbi:hypothetical protein CHH77_18700 [Shouchella clausii]|uniref:alpha/beta hydrolase n=1 Tax=Shouchella clausii TaxID=79880 RepID=UPI000BA64754|nr:alpha/beta hydrolase [Shouchella clausii]PAE79718.1 hypothetical protein CHH77_18700 [Shouchella clausii]
MHIQLSDGCLVYANKRGTGLPTLFLHGGPGYWSGSFEQLAGPILEKTRTMIYLDQRGCGRSQHAPSSTYRYDRLLTDMEEVRRFFGFHKWSVFGHSFGGLLAFLYALQYPNRVDSLILCNTTLYMAESLTYQLKYGSNLLGKTVNPPTQTSLLVKHFQDTIIQLREAGNWERIQFQHTAHAKRLEQADDRPDNQSDHRFQQAFLHSDLFAIDYRKRTTEFVKPVLILAGKHDHAIGPHHYQRFSFPNQQIALLDCGHHPYAEDVASFYKDIERFSSVKLTRG